VGYGGAEVCAYNCWFARFPYSPWQTEPDYRTGVDPAGRLVVMEPRRHRLAVRVINPRTHRTIDRRAAGVGKKWWVVMAYLAPDGDYYVLTSRNNAHENDGRTVAQIRRYSPRLRLEGVAPVKGGLDGYGIYGLPASGASSMVLHGETLLVHTSRFLYHQNGDESWMHHEGALFLAVDTATMRVRQLEQPWVSHSFAQGVGVHGDDVVFLDHGDAYPRAVVMNIERDYFADGEERLRTHELFGYTGRTGDNVTGTTVNGFQLGSDRALTVGVSLPHDHPVRGVSGRSQKLGTNVYLVSTSLGDRVSSRFRWLTTYHPRKRNHVVGQPHLVPLGHDRFAVLFTVVARRGVSMHYRLVNQRGRVLASRVWSGRRYSAVAQPVHIGRKILWVGARIDRNFQVHGHYLFGLNVAHPVHPRIVRR